MSFSFSSHLAKSQNRKLDIIAFFDAALGKGLYSLTVQDHVLDLHEIVTALRTASRGEDSLAKAVSLLFGEESPSQNSSPPPIQQQKSTVLLHWYRSDSAEATLIDFVPQSGYWILEYRGGIYPVEELVRVIEGKLKDLNDE